MIDVVPAITVANCRGVAIGLNTPFQSVFKKHNFDHFHHPSTLIEIILNCGWNYRLGKDEPLLC
jgi:hypothetical protein